MSKKDGKCFFKLRYATMAEYTCRYCGRYLRRFGMSEKGRKESQMFHEEPCVALLKVKKPATT